MGKLRLILAFVFFGLVTDSYSQNNLLPVFKNGKWGVTDTMLNLVYPFCYDAIKPTGNQFLIAEKSGIFSILTSTGESLLHADYQQVEPFVDHYLLVRENERWGIIDHNGKQVVAGHYSAIWTKSNQLAVLESDSGSRLYYFATNTYSNSYDSVVFFCSNWYLLYQDNLFSIYDAKTNSNSEPQHSVYETHGPVFFCIGANNQKNVIDFTNGIRQYETDFFYYSDPDSRYRLYRRNGIMEVLEYSKNRSFQLDAEAINRIIDRRAATGLGSYFAETYKTLYLFLKHGKYGLMDENLKQLLPPEYSAIEIEDTCLSLRKGKNIGLADRQGNVLVPADYERFIKSGRYWIVRIGKQFGVLNESGKEAIKPQYESVELAFENRFIVSKAKKKGLVDQNNKEIIPLIYEDLDYSGKVLIFKQNGMFGIMGENGNLIVKAQYQQLAILNNFFFTITENGRKGIIDANGKVLFTPAYWQIKATENPNLFYVEDFIACNENADELMQKYGVNRSDYETFNPVRYKTGLINSSGQILLDPVFDPHQIIADFEANTVVVKQEEGVLVLTFTRQGKLIDKTNYKNYIAVKKGREPISSDSLPFVWRFVSNLQSLSWGLFHVNGSKFIDYYYKSQQVCPFNPVLSVTIGPEDKMGIVSRKTGRILLEDVYKRLYFNDIQVASFIRCQKSSGPVTLINSDAKILDKGIAFMDDPNLGFMRVNKGGRLKPSSSNTYQLFKWPDEGLTRNALATRSNLVCFGGKWGILDRSGNYLVKPKYDFLQIYFNRVFIAVLNGKWGVIKPDDQLVIGFKYDEIRHLYDTATNSWAPFPFYKVRLNKKWGIIDSCGNTIVPVEFDNVEQFVLNGKIYFKTLVDYSKYPAGIVDTSGNLVLRPSYPFIGDIKNGMARVQFTDRCWKFLNFRLDVFPEQCFTSVRDFSNGYAAVKTKDGWGYINGSGKIIIPNQYPDAGDFINGYAKVQYRLPKRLFGLIKSKRVYSIIDTSGKMVYQAKAENCSNVLNNRLLVQKNKKYTIRNLQGKKMIPGKFLQISDYPEYQVYVLKNLKKEQALIAYDGKVIVPFGKYKNYSSFSEGLCYVSGIKSGFIDTKGNFKFEISCKDTKGFSDGLAAVQIGRKWGFIDTTGKIQIEPQYLDAEVFLSGLAPVKTIKYKQIVIDKSNQTINNKAGTLNSGYFITKNGILKGLNHQNRTIILPVLNGISTFSEGYAVVSIPALHGLYNQYGKMLASPVYPNIEASMAGLIKLITTSEIMYIKP